MALTKKIGCGHLISDSRIDVTFHQLRIFDSVARHLNITHAASELHMSQPAVTHQLKLLEQRYGKQFYRKTGQGIVLTETGLSFLAAVKPILNEVANFEKKFDFRFDQKRGSLKVGGTHSLCATVLPEVIVEFKQSHPEVHFALETNYSQVIEQRILTEGVDLALITHPSYDPNLVVETCQKLEVIAFASASSPLRGKKMTLLELAQVPLVIKKDSKIFKELRDLGYKPTIAVECEASDAVQAAVQKGMGVGILVGDSVKSGIESGTLIKLDVSGLKEVVLESFIVYDKRRPLSPIAKEFLELLRNRKLLRHSQKHRGHHLEIEAGDQKNRGPIPG